MDFAEHIRAVADFPKPGIVFRDITTLLQDARAFGAAVDSLATMARALQPDIMASYGQRATGAKVLINPNLGLNA